jgi:hypothetical protein
MHKMICLLLAALGLSHSALAQLGSAPNFEILDQPVRNTRSYVVFVNLNTSVVEQNYLREMAQRQGYGFLMIPNSKTVNSMAANYANFVNGKCEDQKNSLKIKRCSDWDHQLIESANLNNVDLSRDLPAAFDSIRGNSVKALIFSGHNSDGGFSGDYLAVDTYGHDEIAMKLADQNQKNPRLFAGLNFLGLWGCGSVTLNTMKIYTNVLPSVNLIAGYGATAPSGVRAASGMYMVSAWSHEAALVSARTKPQLRAVINSIQAIHDVYGALWVKTLNMGSFFYVHDEDGTTIEDEKQACDIFMKAKFDRINTLVQNYATGAVEIPEDSDDSPLRVAYYELTEHSSCYDQEKYLSPTQVGSLRFFDSIKQNFVTSFANVLAPSLKEQILKSNRKALYDLAESLKFANGAGQRAGLLIQRYLLDLDDSCYDFLLWHKKADKALPVHCRLDQRGQWIVDQDT